MHLSIFLVFQTSMRNSDFLGDRFSKIQQILVRQGLTDSPGNLRVQVNDSSHGITRPIDEEAGYLRIPPLAHLARQVWVDRSNGSQPTSEKSSVRVGADTKLPLRNAGNVSAFR